MPIQTQKNKVDFYLLGYDGCLGYVPVPKESKQSKAYEISQEIRACQSKEAKKYRGLKAYIDYTSKGSMAVLGVGSNRQLLSMDVSNYRSKKRSSEPFPSSALHTMPKLAKQWGMKFSEFLLEDIAGSKSRKVGATLAGALKKEQDFYDGPDSRPPKIENAFVSSDEHKIGLLYAHIHHMATLPENQGKEITVHFIDDREDILKALQSFYTDSRAKGLIPSNVTLQLGRYAPGEGVTSVQTSKYAPIKGEGLPNPLYADVVRSMGEKLEGIQDWARERKKGAAKDILLLKNAGFLREYREKKQSLSTRDHSFSGLGMLGLHQQTLSKVLEITEKFPDHFKQLLAIRKESRDNFEQLLSLNETYPIAFKPALYAGKLWVDGKVKRADYQEFLSASKTLDPSKPDARKRYELAYEKIGKQLVEFSPERTLLTSLIMTVLATAFIFSVSSFVIDIPAAFELLAKLGECLVENTSFETVEAALTTVSGAALSAGVALITASPRVGSKHDIGIWNGGNSSFFYRSSKEGIGLRRLVKSDGGIKIDSCAPYDADPVGGLTPEEEAALATVSGAVLVAGDASISSSDIEVDSCAPYDADPMTGLTPG